MRYVIDVRYWHLADMGMCTAMSAFGGKADIEVKGFYCPLLTQSGHLEASCTFLANLDYQSFMLGV